MPGFTRRYGDRPGTDVLNAIEGVVIIDGAPPGAVQGQGVGTVAVVGEFADMTYATQADNEGKITTSPRPVEVFGAQDIRARLGGWDPTLGEFGVSGGNGYAMLQGKRFSRLVVVPVNLASPGGVRLVRELPTNRSATNPEPVVALVAATVQAGTEFKDETRRVKLGARVSFKDTPAYLSGKDGVVAKKEPSGDTSLAFTSATGDFTNPDNPVRVGDLLVLGVRGGEGPLGENAGTYRVREVTSATELLLEELNGATFNWTDATNLPWRIHEAAVGDTAAAAVDDVAGYSLPARPIDATISAANLAVPTFAAPAATGTAWSPLSGLGMLTHPTDGLVYDADVQAPNAAANSKLDVLYSTALESLLGDAPPASEVNIVHTARTSATIRTKIRTTVLERVGQGAGMVGILWPELNVTDFSVVVGDTSPGVGSARDERCFWAWPHAQVFLSEAANVRIKGADGRIHDDGMVDVPAAEFLTSILSQLAPERNPGQAADPVKTTMSSVRGFARGTPTLRMDHYVQLRAKGIVGMRRDQTAGFIFQSGVTSSLISGRKNINRRRMADYIQDSVAKALMPWTKEPMGEAFKTGTTQLVIGFLEALLSADNAKAQRIAGYDVDIKSGNTPESEAAGIWTIIGRVRTLATGDTIVFQTEIGEGVVTASAD